MPSRNIFILSLYKAVAPAVDGIQRLVLWRFSMGEITYGLEAGFLERGQVLLVVQWVSVVMLIKRVL
jgi:hypothetical protein